MKPRPLTAAEVSEAYRLYGEMILRRCRVILRDESLADDAFQDAFIKLIRHGARFREATSKLRWLYRLADRCCFDLLSKRKKQPGPLDDRVQPHVTVEVEVRDKAMRILDLLDDKERAIAVMAFVDGMSQREIGEELSWSRQTIHTKLVGIRKKAATLRGGPR